VIFTVAYQIFTEGLLVDSWRALQNSPDCVATGYNLGLLVTELLRFRVAHDVTYDDIDIYLSPIKNPTRKFEEDDTTTVVTP